MKNIIVFLIIGFGFCSEVIAQSSRPGTSYRLGTTYNYSRFERLSTTDSTNFLSRSGYGANFVIERTGRTWGVFLDGTFDAYSFEPPQGVTVDETDLNALRVGLGLSRRMGGYLPYLAIDYDGVILVGSEGTNSFSVTTKDVYKARLGVKVGGGQARFGPAMTLDIFVAVPVVTTSFEGANITGYNTVGANLKLEWGRKFKSGILFGFLGEEYKASANYFTTLITTGLFAQF